MRDRIVTVFGGTGFLGRRVGILGSMRLVFGLHQGMLIAPTRCSMMCSFDGSKPTFMMSGHWRTRLLTLTAR
jgi:hypothetical protein